MRIEQIRNATVRIDYAGSRFLIDPWLQETGTIAPFGSSNILRNPTVPLPKPVNTILENISAYIITHIHPDHFDVDPANWRIPPGGKALSKTTQMFVQNKADYEYMQMSGFKKVDVLTCEGTLFEGIKLIKTSGIHGERNPAGSVMGVVLQTASEKTLYIAGDTIFCDEVERALLTYKPYVIIVNACAAYNQRNGRLIMDGNDIIRIHEILPNSIIIASHMESVNHATLTREALRNQMLKNGIGDFVLIPQDGEVLTIYPETNLLM